MKKNELTVAYSTDERYFPLTLVSMISCVENNPKANFIILYTELTELSFNSIDWFREKYSVSVILKAIDKKEFADFPLSRWVTIPAWFRIKLADLFPELTQILYLDCDTIVLKDLSALWEIDWEDNYVMVVPDVWQISTKKAKKIDNYFNSGVILINCEKWRADHLYDKCRDYAISSFDTINFCDQDTLNAVIGKQKILLDPRYNFMDTWWRRHYYEYKGEFESKYLEARTNSYIVHFTGCKPWERGCKHIFFNKWWYYAKKSPIFSNLKENFKKSVVYHKRRPFFRWLFNFHYFLWKNSKIPILTILGKEFFLCSVSAKCRKELRFYRQY